ncbi:alkene reductase [Granulicella arctica]|uniref:alkene reductase n=1 Tax=Granulicella arctica TaxID=940613 RepID=UPI0021E05F88|nr:alkene reductase [Granulicella arctica]
MPSLLDPIQLGDLYLPNRVFMAPLTRLRGTPDHVPTSIMVEYYTQRASAGLIISEATPVDPFGVGYANVPGIWSQQQTEAWMPITKAIHDHGGHIFAQLWHVGRISDPIFLDGQLPVAPSAIAPKGMVSLVRPQREFVTPRALELSEIKGVVEAFRRGAQNAQIAGFDGVELHGANGYLLDQFLQDGSNHRTDEYGGPIENRARLMLECTDAAISVFGPGRVGMHLAPRGDSHGISDSNLAATFSYVARELGKRKLAFIAAREHVAPDSLGPTLKELFGGVYVANEAIHQQAGQQLLDEGKADAVAFGKLFIANPDLPLRFSRQSALNAPVPSTFYAPGAEGYTDYPSLQG